MGVGRQTRVLHSGDNERVDRCLRGFWIGRVRPARVFVPNPPGDPESADGRLAGLSRLRLRVGAAPGAHHAALSRPDVLLLYALGEAPTVVMDEMGHTDPGLALHPRLRRCAAARTGLRSSGRWSRAGYGQQDEIEVEAHFERRAA